MPSLALALLLLAAAGLHETFSAGLTRWWVEGGEQVAVRNGQLHVQADRPGNPGGTVATVWHRTPHPADFSLELDAHVVSSSTSVNNINLFFSYTDPSGTPLEDTRESRKTAEYERYHQLSGYIVTFLNDAAGEGGRAPDGSTLARVRRNPGFRLLAETFTGHCRAGVTYRLSLVKRGGDIRFSVDGRELLRATDPEPLGPGHLGLRTFRTWLWWDNLRLTPLN